MKPNVMCHCNHCGSYKIECIDEFFICRNCSFVGRVDDLYVPSPQGVMEEIREQFMELCGEDAPVE